MPMPNVGRTCSFSPCRRYRYSLKIIWDTAKPVQMFIGLNPSTADETNDDPTVRRCIGFCKAWGAGGLLMTNIFAFRATDPKVMLAEDEPVGEDNTIACLARMWKAQAVGTPAIAAWGTHGKHGDRGFGNTNWRWKGERNYPVRYAGTVWDLR